jgi:hypothetical protein
MKANTAAAEKQVEEGEKYVLVKDGDKETPEASNISTESKEGIDCPEIIYKVQYKDFNGDIKGTKVLDAPYKLKKTTLVHRLFNKPNLLISIPAMQMAELPFLKSSIVSQSGSQVFTGEELVIRRTFSRKLKRKTKMEKSFSMRNLWRRRN